MQPITGKTKLLGVIGDPVTHSLSPLIHNAAIAELGRDYVYVAFPIKPENLATAIAGFQAVGVVGFSITIPHKQTIIPLLNRITPTAQLVGAVNTVRWTESGWEGTNTDVEGFIAPLNALNRDWTKVSPVVLGIGGAARAVVVGLAQLGCSQIHVVGRNVAKLEAFHQSWQNSDLNAVVAVHPWENLPLVIPHTELLVNTTPLGMAPNIDASPVTAELLQRLHQSAIAYDLIYNPSPTRFLQDAQTQGNLAIDGLEMLVQQGAAALQLWLQEPVPVDTMRQVLKNHLFPA